LAELGYCLIIHPGAITRAVVQLTRAVLGDLRTTGSTKGWLDRMATFADVNALLGLPEANEWEVEISKRAAEVGDSE